MQPPQHPIRETLKPDPASADSVEILLPSLRDFPSASAAAVGGLPAQFGRYRVLKKLGEGGMGSVYLAHDTQLDRPVALKVPHPTLQDSPKVVERFYREARAAAQLHHPNLCPVHDVGQIDGVHYLTMACVDGTPLADTRAR